MGSLSLVCPMCCGETFTTSQSLKYHLLSITDNLYCPKCDERSDTVAALIHHLDDCGSNRDGNETRKMEIGGETQDQEDQLGINDSSMNRDGRGDFSHQRFLARIDRERMIIVGEPRTIEVDEYGEIKVVERMDTREVMSHEAPSTENHAEVFEDNGNITDVPSDPVNGSLENTIKLEFPEEFEEVQCTIKTIAEEEEQQTDKQDADEKLEKPALTGESKEGTTEDSEAMYSCSSCGMSFNSVLDHIKEYHDGQEVVLEMSEDMNELAEDSTTVPSSVPEYPETDAVESRILERGDLLPSTNQSGRSRHQRQTMNTLRSEECIDSEGRVYTRKVVQIERFWDRSTASSSRSNAQQQQQQEKEQPQDQKTQTSSQRPTRKSSPMIEKFFSNAEGVKTRNAATRRPSSSPNTGALGKYRCNKCLEQFPKLGEFRLHACAKGTDRCELCDEKFASPRALQLHSRIHEVVESSTGEPGLEDKFVCPTCGTRFSSHKSLRLHSRMHAPIRARHVDAPEGTEKGNFTCHECGKTLSESYRKAHMSLHSGDSVTCTVCNRKFDSSDSLAMHAAVHTELGVTLHSHSNQVQQQQEPEEERKDNLGVDSCRTKLQGDRDTGSAAANAAAVALDTQKPYQCQHCGRRFTRPHEKVKHERIHTGEKPHACEVCGKTFRVSYCLTLHMRTHTGVRPYGCQHCGKRFKASSVYNHHLLTHGDERAYTCPYCPKTFKTRVQLAGHKNSHTKPFRCTECSRPFASLYAARAHIQTHKRDNNFKFSCCICGASYGRAFALKDHLKQHAGQEELLVTGSETNFNEDQVLKPDIGPDTDDLIRVLVSDTTDQHSELGQEQRRLTDAATTLSNEEDDENIGDVEHQEEEDEDEEDIDEDSELSMRM